MKVTQLPMDYAIILQQISDDGADCLEDLSSNMRVKQSRLLHIVNALKHKGLIKAERVGYETWLSLTTKGDGVMRHLWPEAI